MRHDLFEEITAPTSGARARSPYTLTGSIAVHVIVIATIVIVPLLATDKLPTPFRAGRLVTPVAPVPPPPPMVRRPPPGPLPPVLVASASANDAVPLDAPDGLHDVVGPVPSVALTIGEGSPDGVPGGIGDAVVRPAPSLPASPSRPLQIGGKIREPQKVFSVAPLYPAIARAARISGMVVIEAIIGVDGQVSETHIRASVPLLDQAALDAVRQWRYRPTLLNGVPVPVIMTVSVRFTLE